MLSETYVDRICWLVEQASENLIEARIVRQEEQVAAEFDVIYGHRHIADRTAEILEESASLLRFKARENLREAEKLNGKLFVMGDKTLPLKRHLSGKTFRKWPIYKHLYKKSELFNGVDPD